MIVLLLLLDKNFHHAKKVTLQYMQYKRSLNIIMKPIDSGPVSDPILRVAELYVVVVSFFH